MENIPAPFSALPFYRLRYDKPSPVVEYSRHIEDDADKPGSTVKFWMKREDQSSPLVCCGNKYRKLEYIIPDILATPNVSTIVTEGGLQSNHAAQVSAVASKLGLECILLLDEESGGLGTAPSPDVFRSAGNFQVYGLLGAKTRVYRGPSIEQDVMKELRSVGKVPYWIPMGASMHALGGLGYAKCAFEIAAQEKDLSLGGTGRFDYIFVACGSGSTLAGLLAGFRMLEQCAGQSGQSPKRQLIGIMVSPKTGHEETVLSIAQNTGTRIGINTESQLELKDIRLDDRFIGGGYGDFDAKTQRTVREFLQTDGVLMDPVYSGKALRGMMHWIKSRELEKDCLSNGHPSAGSVNTLFIHTGGQTVFSSYASTV